jgi:nicotinamidase-related amidase
MKAYFMGEPRLLPPDDADFDAFFEPEKTAVIEIDMHRGHLGGPGCTCPLDRGIPKIEAHNQFNDAARRCGVKVIHVRLIFRADGIDHLTGPHGVWSVIPLYKFLWGPVMDRISEHNLEGSEWTQFVVEVKEGDCVVNNKKRYSCFYATDLEFLLRRLGIENVVITGVMTDACDLATAYDAVNRDFRVLIPRDVAVGTEENEEKALDIISMHVGLVVDSSDLIAEWEARSYR